MIGIASTLADSQIVIAIVLASVGALIALAGGKNVEM